MRIEGFRESLNGKINQYEFTVGFTRPMVVAMISPLVLGEFMLGTLKSQDPDFELSKEVIRRGDLIVKSRAFNQAVKMFGQGKGKI